jgi:outer membrane receptor for ferrienterochelin and colicins
MGLTYRFRHAGCVLGLLYGCVLYGCVAALPLAAQEQQAPRDSLWKVELPQVVVTATKGAKALADVPVPTQVVTARDAAAQGAFRLSDLLAEQTGLTLVYDHGAGLQVQGFDSDYTLILIDGEPVIGRTAGTLDLERLTVADVERVEVVRGPSSSLYGSEALAGVVNIITRKPAEVFKGHAAARYQTHDTFDLTASADLRHERLGGRFLFNRYSSGGYDLDPDVVGPTLPGFTDYTSSARLTFDQSV